jgi:hypothetical protein
MKKQILTFIFFAISLVATAQTTAIINVYAVESAKVNKQTGLLDFDSIQTIKMDILIKDSLLSIKSSKNSAEYKILREWADAEDILKFLVIDPKTQGLFEVSIFNGEDLSERTIELKNMETYTLFRGTQIN